MLKKLATILLICILNFGIVEAKSFSNNPMSKMSSKKEQKLSQTIAELKAKLKISQDDTIDDELIKTYVLRANLYKKSFQKEKYALDLQNILFYSKIYSDSSDFLKIFDETSLKLIKYERRNRIDNSSDSKLGLASKLFYSKNFEAAGWVYYSLISRDFANIDCYTGIGDVFMGLNEPSKAVRFYTYALSDESGAENEAKRQIAKTKLALSYEAMGDYVKSRAILNQFIYKLAKDKELLTLVEYIYEQRLKKEPKNPDNYIALGMIYQRQGNFNEAYNFYKKSLTLKADDIFIKYLLGPLFFENKKYSEALKVFNEILAFQPTDSQIRTFKAQSLLALGKKNDAVKEYEYILRLYPESLETKIVLYDLIKKEKTPKQIITYLFPIYRVKAVDEDAYYMFGKILQNHGKNDDAVIFYKMVIELNPKYTIAYQDLTRIYENKEDVMSIYYLLKGAEVSKNPAIKGIYDSASGKYNQKLSAHAEELMKKEQYKSAIDFYRQINPQDYQSTLAIATCYQLLKDNPNALKYYNKALYYNPKSAKIHYYMGIIAYNQGDYKQAKDHLKKAISLDDKDDKTKNLLTHVEEVDSNNSINLAYEYYEKRDYNAALNVLNAMIKIYPQNAQAFYYRGIVYDAVGKYDLAIESFKSSYHVDNDAEDIDYYIGRSYDKWGKKQEAIKAYDKYLNTNPQDTDYILYAQKRVIELGGISN